MTWRQVARKDFEDVVRSKMLWSIVTVFVAFMGFMLLVATQVVDPEGSGSGTVEALAFVAGFGKLFVPVVALVAGYMAVVGERRSGSLRVLLGYPHSRRDVVAGKLVGRAGVIVLAFVAGFALMTVLVAALFSFPPVETFLSLVAVATLFGLAFTGIAVGISAAAPTRGKAMALAIGTFLLCLVFWEGLAAGVHYAVHDSLPGLEADAWYFLLKRLNPIAAYDALTAEVLDSAVATMVNLPVEDVPRGTPPEQLRLENRVEGDLPVYLEPWFSAVILLAWGVVPAALGYRRFERADL